MLVNVGEAYIVVNIINGRLVDQDTDLMQYQSGETGQQIKIASGLDIYADEPSAKLKLKIFGGPSAGEIYYYQ